MTGATFYGTSGLPFAKRAFRGDASSTFKKILKVCNNFKERSYES
jgi:hypothetical protein